MSDYATLKVLLQADDLDTEDQPSDLVHDFIAGTSARRLLGRRAAHGERPRS